MPNAAFVSRGFHCSRRLIVIASAIAMHLAVAMPSRADAQDVEIPVSVHVPLFLKVLTFDRHLPARARRKIVVGIAHQSGHRPSTVTRDEVLYALEAARESLEGYAISSVAIDLDKEPLGEALKRHGVLVLYVAPLRAVDVAAIATTARSMQVTTLTGVPRYIALGLAIGVRLQGERPRLLINIDSARLEGANFKAELLKLAQVVR